MLCGLYLEILFIFFKLEITDNFIFECVLAHECNGTMEPAPRGLQPLLTGSGALPWGSPGTGDTGEPWNQASL